MKDKRSFDTLPYLVADGEIQRCSICGYPFSSEVKPSIDAAFVEHLGTAHQPGQAGDMNRAAARILGEAAKP